MTARLVMMTVLLLSAILVQTVVLPGIAIAGVPPHLVVLTVVGFGVADGPSTGARYGFAAGIVLDVVGTGSQLVGVSALVMLLAGHASGALRPYLSGTGVVGQVAVASAVTVVVMLLLGVLVTLLEVARVGIGEVLVTAAVAGLYNGALAPFVIPAVAGLSRRFPALPAGVRA